MKNAWWGMIQYGALMMALLGGVVCFAIVFWVYVDTFWKVRNE